MTAAEMKAVLVELGWSQAYLARRLGKHVNTVTAWVNDDEVPKYAAEYLRAVRLAKQIVKGE